MPKINLDDTIAAIATPLGEGGISVIRVSGPEAFAAVDRVFRGKGKIAELPSHTIHFGCVEDSTGAKIDQVLVSIFRAPHSYTGEDVAEISSHGGIAVTRTVLGLLLGGKVRPAEPGEFTKRAFLNGRIDLTQAEAVLDLIRAKSELSVKTAMSQLGGSLSRRFRDLRERLMKVYAHMEAYVDFPEEDIEVYSDRAFLERFDSIREDVRKLIASFRRGSLFREGLTCVIAGRPNAGKSSLFNALLERDRALVSEIAGTTRDMIEESIEIEGLYIRLVDTAGLGLAGAAPLDRIGMERTREAVKEAGLILFVVDGSQPLTPEDFSVYEEICGRCPVILIANKSDLGQKASAEELSRFPGTAGLIPISTLSREGFDRLEKVISETVLGGHLQYESEQVTRLRHKQSLEAALASLENARMAFERRESLDLVTLDLRTAFDQLSELVGEIYSEDLLDVIFSEFCIGK